MRIAEKSQETQGPWRKLWAVSPLRTGHKLIDLLLLFVPLAFVARYLTRSGALLTFSLAAVAVIPLAGALGESTGELATHVGTRVGALVNATMGNASELIIGVALLSSGHTDIVKASLSGSIICNILFVFGMSALVGGIGRERQEFSSTAARLTSTLLFVSVVALIIPAIFSLSIFGSLQERGPNFAPLSLWTSVVLLIVYFLSLVFTLSRPSFAAAPQRGRAARSLMSSLISLGLATVLLALVSQILVDEIEQAKRILGWSDLFMGVIVIAIIGNAAEHAVAVMMARRNRMELALGVTAGSSVQIALLIAPLLVLISWVIHQPMSLVFTPLEIAGVALAVLIVTVIALDGQTTWFEGAELLAVYVIFAISAYFMPGVSP
jgi:Ca2+:H+ antiporter